MIWLTVVFCAFHSSLANRYLNEPSKRFVPDLVMTLTIAPCARPYSAPTAEVSTLTSWIASKFRFVPNVPVVGSVVSTASMTNRLLRGQRAGAIDVAGANHARRGADQRLIAAADRQLFELVLAETRRRRHGRRDRRSAFRR